MFELARLNDIPSGRLPSTVSHKRDSHRRRGREAAAILYFIQVVLYLQAHLVGVE